ncbi:elongation factor P maturation arginine rhamnosyltransferase EarP [Candidatus Gracilibacteria bacterium]|nr:elongation factor P maturation arginine rhamnosyltransferase EarP [Candidatus Gracilibacteria bacterium]
MKQAPIIIDIFVDIVDNYGDMGFACECIMAQEHEYPGIFDCVIWTNNTQVMRDFARSFGMRDIFILDISEFGNSRKSNIAISMLHASIPDLDLFSPRALILRIDYISLDPLWIQKNETEHISSTENHQIIELIPSPLSGSAGLLSLFLSSRTKQSETTGSVAIQVSGHGLLHSSQGQKLHKSQKHITVFCYTETLNHIDWDTFPDDILVYVFGKVESKKSNIIHLDFLPSSEFYSLLDSSEFVIIRGEVSFAHMIQSSVPFFWDMYRGIGGFPEEQSKQFLSFLGANEEYRGVHQILNGQISGIISYQNIIGALSHTQFGEFRTQNLIHTVKKHIDRFYNSI